MTFGRLSKHWVRDMKFKGHVIFQRLHLPHCLFGFLAVCLFGCATPEVPDYKNSLAELGAPVKNNFKNTSLGVIVSENTQLATDYIEKQIEDVQQEEGVLSRDKKNFVNDVNPKDFMSNLNRILDERFRSVTVYDTLDAARQDERDLMMVLNVQF